MIQIKKVKNYDNYFVTSLGTVYSNKSGKMKELKQTLKDKYLVVRLKKDDGTSKIATVHKLVVDAFIKPSKNLTCINHKNEIKTDNRLENLERCTRQYNNNYGTKKERISKSLREKDKLVVSSKIACRELGLIFDTTSVCNNYIAALYNLNYFNVLKVLDNGGFYRKHNLNFERVMDLPNQLSLEL